MKKLEHLLPFLTLLIVLAMLVILSEPSFGAMVKNNICTFKLQTAPKGKLKHLIPSGLYRITGENKFQMLQNSRGRDLSRSGF